MAALPSIWSFLTAFPAVIWSLDWTRTNPGWSSSSKICFVFPSLSFWPILNSGKHCAHEMEMSIHKYCNVSLCSQTCTCRCTVPGVDAIVLFVNKSWKTKHKMEQSASQLKKLQTEEVVWGVLAAQEGRGVALRDFDNQSRPSAHSASQSQQCIAYHVRAKMLVLQQKYDGLRTFWSLSTKLSPSPFSLEENLSHFEITGSWSIELIQFN